MLTFDDRIQNMRHCDFVIYRKLEEASRVYIYECRGRTKGSLFEDYVNAITHKKKAEIIPLGPDISTVERLFNKYGALLNPPKHYLDPFYVLGHFDDFDDILTKPLWTKENPWLLPSLKITNLD